LILVKPETVVLWLKQGFKRYWRNISKSSPGRPAISARLRALIRKMAKENNWGSPRIHSELMKLGIDISQATVARYLPQKLVPPSKVEQWKKLLKNHQHDIAAMDFFAIPTASFKLLYEIAVIHHSRCRILHFNVTEHPTAAWII
jgi:putative transposase